MRHIYRFFFLCLALIGGMRVASAMVPLPEDKSSAVILAYHMIGEDAFPDTSLRAEQFQAHLDELLANNYTVLPLQKIVEAIKANTSLPPRSIAITFEGGYKSAMQDAMPALIKANIPFTVFFASDYADARTAQYLNWNDLRSLQKSGLVDFGLLPANYERLANAPREEILSQLNKARTRAQKELGLRPQLFSYPFGEYSAAYRDIIEDQGFTGAFGLQSGALYHGSDMMALPRFSMTENYGNLERFQLVTHALPLPATDIEPEDPSLTMSNTVIGFSMDEALIPYLKSLSCFISGQGQPTIALLGENRIQLRPLEPLSDGRIRINCTMPVKTQDEDQSWRWLGLLLVNEADASQEQPARP